MYIRQLLLEISPHDDGFNRLPIGRDPRDRQRMKVTEENSRDARTHFM